MRRPMTLARGLSVLLALLLLPARVAQAGPCPAVPSVDPIDMGLSEVSLSSTEAERVLRLRAAVSHHMAQRETAPARAALFDAMQFMGYTYLEEAPKARATRACPPGSWQRQP